MSDTCGYREYPPPADLARHVACTWTSVGRAGGSPSAIIPDGCADLIVFGDAEPQVAGPASVTQWVRPQAAGTLIVGLRLRPGAVRAILDLPAGRLLNVDAPLSAVCGRAARPLLCAIAANDAPTFRRHALEGWVRGRLDAARAPDLAALHAADRLTAAPGLSVDALAADLGWSPRRLHRELVATTGYGPKRLQRIMRVQRVIRLSGEAASLADLAFAAGFADQAHMTRDFREVTGFTPAGYLAGVSLAVGQWLQAADSFKT